MATTKREMMMKVFIEALDRPEGVEIMLEGKHEATRFRFYLYNLRAKLRKLGHPRMEEIETLDLKVKLYPELTGQCAVTVKVGGRLFDDLRIIDAATGENITKKFEAVDEVVQIDESEFGK